MMTPAKAVQTYILAKDGNRPFLMREAFAEDAELETVVKSDAISFPSAAKGLQHPEDVLVRRFNADNENIFTFCLSEPSEADRARFQCDWLVGMSTKATRQLRIGCGNYDWYFDGVRQGCEAHHQDRGHEDIAGRSARRRDALVVRLAISMVSP